MKNNIQAYFVSKRGGINSFQLDNQPITEPGKGELLIKVKAAAFNFREIMIIESGTYPLPVKDRFIPLCDGVGEVVAVGEGTTKFKVGSRVAAIVFPQWQDGPFNLDSSLQLGGSADGMLAEYKVLPESGVLAIPAHLSWEEAAAFPCAGVTAWHALTGGHPLLAGETVLTMGTGAVSLFVVQFARLFGARVIATTSSSEKYGILKSLGADEVINYVDQPDWHKTVRELTGGYGVDHIVELGGSGTLVNSMQSLSISGQISQVGWLAKERPLIDMSNFTGAGSIRRVALGHRRHQVEMNRAVEVGKIVPVIDRVFPFEQAKEAYAYYLAGKYLGKVIINFPE
jgi:NADPH:quinone reductase-like Zn-dependent oxidoreductase